MQFKVEVVMGCPGSGKTTFSCKLQKENPDSEVISCGDLYRNHHMRYPFLESESKKGKNYWIEALKKFIILAIKDELTAIQPDTTLIIIDGLWGDNLPDFINEIAPINKIHYIYCTKDVAKQRLIDRNRSDDNPYKINSRLSSYFNREPELLEKIKGYVQNISFYKPEPEPN